MNDMDQAKEQAKTEWERGMEQGGPTIAAAFMASSLAQYSAAIAGIARRSGEG